MYCKMLCDLILAENDKNFKTSTVSRYIELIKKNTLPDGLIHISCWVRVIH